MTEPARSSPPFGLIVAVLVLLVVAALVAVLSRGPSVEEPVASTLPPTAESRATSGQAPVAVEPPAQARTEAPAVSGAAAGAGEAAAPAQTGAAGVPPRPSDRRGTAGAPPPLTAQAMMRRAFVAGRSSVENRRGVGDDVSGFDVAGSKGVEVKRAPEIPGRIEFSMQPLRVKPGDSYTLRISLVNEGKKTIEVEEIRLRTVANGKETTAKVKPQIREVASHQNEVVYELTGAWERTTTSWSLEAVVTSERQDVYRNRVTWK